MILKEQVGDLQGKLLEKDELLKSAENSKNQMNDLKTKFDELMRQASEKDTLLKSAQHQLSDTKVPFYFFYCSITNLPYSMVEFICCEVD